MATDETSIVDLWVNIEDFFICLIILRDPRQFHYRLTEMLKWEKPALHGKAQTWASPPVLLVTSSSSSAGTNFLAPGSQNKAAALWDTVRIHERWRAGDLWRTLQMRSAPGQERGGCVWCGRRTTEMGDEFVKVCWVLEKVRHQRSCSLDYKWLITGSVCTDHSVPQWRWVKRKPDALGEWKKSSTSTIIYRWVRVDRLCCML